jgi:hypothetical protein
MRRLQVLSVKIRSAAERLIVAPAVRRLCSGQQVADAWLNARSYFSLRGTNNGDDRRGLIGSTSHCLAVLLNPAWPCILLLLGQILCPPTTLPMRAPPAKGLAPVV